jgi:ABC-type transporter Mla maintaining outer membrane lipid asymmetry ATPase subunit MlaF
MATLLNDKKVGLSGDSKGMEETAKKTCRTFIEGKTGLSINEPGIID